MPGPQASSAHSEISVPAAQGPRAHSTNDAIVLSVTDSYRQLLVDHIRYSLIHEYQVRKFDVWRGKDGLFQYPVEEVARVMVDALWPLLDSHAAEIRARQLHDVGKLAPVLDVDPSDW